MLHFQLTANSSPCIPSFLLFPHIAHLYFNIPIPRPLLQNGALCLPPIHTRVDSDSDSGTRRVLHACARVAADRANSTSSR